MTASDDGQPKGSSVDTEEVAAYRRVVSQFPTICLMLARPDGSIVAEWVGEDIARISGYGVDELEADPDLWLNIIHPADRERVRRAWRQLGEGKHAHTEYRIFRKDGQMRWIADTGAAAEATERGLVRSIRCTADITTAKAGKEWSIDFEELVDQTPVAVTVRDLKGRMLYCNEATALMYGFESSCDLLNTTFEDVMDSEFAKEFREQVFPPMLTGPSSGELVLRTQNGRQVNLRISSNLFRDDRGRPVAVYSILTDISQLKETEQALMASEEHLRAVQDSLPANLAVIDGDGKVIAVNERWRRFARENGDPGLTHTCEGVNYLDVCRRARGHYSEGAAEALEGISAILRGESDRFEMEYPCPSPTRQRTFFMRAAALSGGQAGAVIAHIDISARVRAEEALRESEEKYRSMAQNLDAVVFRIDRSMTPIALAGHVRQSVGLRLGGNREASVAVPRTRAPG